MGTGTHNQVKKLFSNGAEFKVDFSITYNADDTINTLNYNSKINAYHGDNDEDAQYIKYKELGQKQYNYDKQFYEIQGDCTDSDSPIYGSDKIKCQYLYDPLTVTSSVTNKYLYDNWLTTLIFGCLISVSNFLLIIFGCLLIKNKVEHDLLTKNENEPDLLIKNDNDPNLILNNNLVGLRKKFQLRNLE